VKDVKVETVSSTLSSHSLLSPGDKGAGGAEDARHKKAGKKFWGNA